MSIERIKRVPLREVWSHEAHDFTAWLRENLEVVSEAIDRQLVFEASESAAGEFRVDIVAQDIDGDKVVIENQLEASDHDHLGKVVTYLSAYAAKTAVWIVAEARPEHTTAIAWLNQSTDADFFLLKAEAIRIADSPSALLLTRIVGPSEEARRVGQTRRDLADRDHERKEFWAALLERASNQSHPHRNCSARPDSWLGASTGVCGFSLQYGVMQSKWRVLLYIDLGAEAPIGTKAAFDALKNVAGEIEQRFGASLDWNRYDKGRACIVSSQHETGGYRSDRTEWPRIQDAMISAMLRLEAAIRPHLATAAGAAASAAESVSEPAETD